MSTLTEERRRLLEARTPERPWKKWGPHLSERQWGTVREDYSADGSAWDHFTHDQARSRAYRWGEDGIGGISDDQQQLCFALALWNGRDPILKERMFGLTNNEGNHGEDVKEYYYYLDSTPTHSFMKYLYKYPQGEFPYADLVEKNRSRNRHQLEYELIDTGVFDEDRYFDVVVEYAEAAPEDLLIRIEAINRGSEEATLHLLPTLWFRNTWSWNEGDPKPRLDQVDAPGGTRIVTAQHPVLGTYHLYCDTGAQFLFTENETNSARVFGQPSSSPYVKDGINDYVVLGREDVLNPNATGTKASAYYRLAIPPGGSFVVRLRLSDTPPGEGMPLGEGFDIVFGERKREADAFYKEVSPPALGEDERQVVRQALAGMLWSKQFYAFDVATWLREHGADPSQSAQTRGMRNEDWIHMFNGDVISMPDKWEYPWFAAWDLAFHAIPLAMVDPDFAKAQLNLLLRQDYLHPNGQLPAYEWNFNDVNPPVHCWAAYYIYWTEKQQTGEGDLRFLKNVFLKLLMNFTWWVNRKDLSGNNLFQGGFLGLDNIGVFDRSAPLPTGGYLEQADGTAWMAMYCQNMLSIALELALDDPVYEELACKFYEHFLWIASAMDRPGNNHDELWDEEDGFYYDVRRLPDGNATRLRVRSMVGLLPLCAASLLRPEMVSGLPALIERASWFTREHPELTESIADITRPGVRGLRLLGVLNEPKLRRVLARMLDENEFLSPYGIRALSRFHRDHPFVFLSGGQENRVDYEPAESTTGLFGGNSNWRGPIWMPVNGLLVRALLILYSYYGDEFTVECPTGSGRQMNLFEVAHEISNRLAAIFLRDGSGKRPVFGAVETFQEDPNWRDYLQFYEYFHGDNGAGIGASHQTGWTGLVAVLLQLFGSMTASEFLDFSSGQKSSHREPQAAAG